MYLQMLRTLIEKMYGRDSRLTTPEIMTDYCTAPGAQRLADKICAYWWGKGCTVVHAWVDCDHVNHNKIGHAEISVVRSNLINGLPPQNGARS